MIFVLVFVGSILVAAGGLYFIDIKFCKDWFQAMIMLVGGLLMVAGGEIAVTGSSASFFKAQQVRTSLCELEGEGAHPNERRDNLERVIFKHIVGCMNPPVMYGPPTTSIAARLPSQAIRFATFRTPLSREW